MLGVLIINGYLLSDKFSKFYEFIIESFSNVNIKLDVIKNTDIPVILNNDPFDKKYEFILFFDKDIILAKHLEKLGYNVYNSSSAIEICDDKGKTHIELENNKEIVMPKTLLIPFSYKKDFPSFSSILKKFNLPFIVKERKGSFGEQVFLVYSEDDWNRIILESSANLLVQEYIGYHYHEDYRIYVVNHEVKCVLKRIGKENDFRANVTLGGHMKEVEVNQDFINMAKVVSKSLNLSFAGLDFIEDKNGKPIFIEANSNAHFLNAYNVCRKNIALEIAKFIKNDLNKS